MEKRKFPRVEVEPVCKVRIRRKKCAVAGGIAVPDIPDNGRPEMGEMDADLVRLAGFQKHVESRPVNGGCIDPVPGAGKCAGRSDAHGGFALGISSPLQGHLDFPFEKRRPAVADGTILFCKRPPSKQLVQTAECLLVFGNEDGARGIAIEPVHEGKIIVGFYLASCKQVRGGKVDQGIVVKVAAARMNDKPDRFIADEQIGILMQDGKIAPEKIGFHQIAVRTFLQSRSAGELGRVDIDIDRIPESQPVILADPAMPGNPDSAAANQRINAR